MIFNVNSLVMMMIFIWNGIYHITITNVIIDDDDDDDDDTDDDDDDDDDEAFFHHHPADSMPTLTTNPLIPLGAATDDSGRR